MDSCEKNHAGSMKYVKAKGTSSQLGIYYEQDVTALISLLALYYDDFSLISNPPNCAPFDDIILCTRKANRNVIFLFQAKLKESGEAIKDEEFRDQFVCNEKGKSKQRSKLFVGTLYKRYLESKKSIQDIIPSLYTEGCEFKIIICTNRPIQTNSEIFQPVSDDCILTRNYGKFYKFNKEFIRRNLCSSDDFKEEEDFLKSISYVFADQNCVVNTSIAYIENSYKTECNIALKIQRLYFQCIKNWWEINTEKEYLTKDFVRKLLMYTAFKQFQVSIDNYKESDYRKYKDIFQKTDHWGDEDCSELLWESIKNNKLNISDIHKQYIMGKALEDLNRVHIGADISYYQQIISDSHPPSENQLRYYIGCLLNKLPFLVENCGLAITEDCNTKIVFIGSIGGKRRENFMEVDENVLNMLKQQKITTEFGQSFNLGDIIEEISDYTISDILSLIMDTYNTKINKKEVLIDMRVKKVLLDEEIFAEENRGHMENDVFIITGCPAYEFMKYFKISTNSFILLEDKTCEYLLEQNQENTFAFSIETVNYDQCKVKFTKQFKYIFLANASLNIKTQPPGNFHFIRFVFPSSTRKFRIEWLGTKGKIANINRFSSKEICDVIQNELSNIITFVYTCNCCIKSNQIINYFQNNNSFMVISGVPGIGKTTILKQFPRTLATNNFIIYVALSNHYEYFQNYENNFTKSNAEDHINYFYNNKNTILNSFFAKKLEKNQIIILLDGFDEIAPQYTEVASEIINQIKKQNYKIILSTRSILKTKVENLFDTLSLSLTPLNLEDRRILQKIYFNKYVIQLINIDYHSKFSSAVEINVRRDVEFFNVPLNLQLFLEVFVNEIKTLNDLPWHYKLNQVQLYENYINNRLEIYSKMNQNMDKSLIDEYHKYFSIKKIFCNLPQFIMIEGRINIKLEHYIQNLRRGGEKVGILIGDIDEIVMHRTVAEYFCAKWLYDLFFVNNSSNNFQINPNEMEFGRFIIKIINLSLPFQHYNYEYAANDDGVKFSVVRHFFDLMINQTELHKAAYEGNYEYVNQIFQTDITTVKTLNTFRRNLLYTIILNDSFKDFTVVDHIVAVNEDLVVVIKLLIKHFKDILTQEDFSQISVQKYIQQKDVIKDAFKVIIYYNKALDRYIIYYNRPFQLWELFHSENLYNYNIDKLLHILQIDQTKISSMFSAVRDKNHNVIEQFFESGININFLTWPDIHLYHIAAGEGCLDVITLLDTYGMQEHRKSFARKDRSLMHYAVVGGNLKIINYLEKNQLDLEKCDEYGLSPFHYAIIFNKIDLVKYFLKQDLFRHSIYFRNKCGYSSAVYAAAFGNKEIFELLLKTAGGLDIDGETPIHLITYINCCINKKFDSLVHSTNKEKNTFINKQNKYNEKCFDFVKLLHGDYSINYVGNITPFIIAVKFRNKKLVEYLIEISANINYIGEFGTTSLHIAASNCDIEMLKLLLKHIDINVHDQDMNSVLHYAVEEYNAENCFEVVDYLIKNGARADIANDKGTTPLHLSIKNGNFKATKLLIDQTNSNVNVQTKRGHTPLHYAVFFQKFQAVKYLIEKKADINLPDNENLTPLDFAYSIIHKDLSIISYLEGNNAISNKTTAIDEEMFVGRFPFNNFRSSESFNNYFKALESNFAFVPEFYWDYADF